MRFRRMLFAVMGAVAVIIVVSACSGAKKAQAISNPNAPITVWVDAARAPQAQAYAKAHPQEHITVDIVSAGQGANTSAIALAEKAGKGIPDVIFLGSPNEVTTLLANPINYPLALNSRVSKKILSGFTSGTISRCTFNSQVYCLGNDEGQTVLWYNKVLFKKWGYQVPATFAQFKALGMKLAQQHPGYNLGTVSGRYGVEGWFTASGCPMLDPTTNTTVKINTMSPNCVRVGDVIGPLMANGTLSTLDLFNKTYDTEIAEGKVVAFIGASWTADFAFKPMTTNSGTKFDAAGKFAAAPMPRWSGEKNNWSGEVGGGIWIVSRQSKNPKNAVAFAVAMTTSPSIGQSQSTYPAYGPNADIWLKAKANDKWYAADPSSVLRNAAQNVNPANGYTRYQTQAYDSYNATVIKNGAKNMSAALKAWGTQLTQAAESTGYTVTH